MKGVTQFFAPVSVVCLLAAITLPGHAAPTSSTAAPVQAALDSLIQSPSFPLPPGTRLLGVNVHDGLAIVNFNRALTDNFQGGDSQAAETVSVILKTAGHFPAVNTVQILEDGRIPGALGGLIVLSSPLPVIRPESAASPLYYHRVSAHPHAAAHGSSTQP